MRRSGIVFAVVFLLMSLQVNSAQAGLLEFLFPNIKRQTYDPSKTMKAPFAQDRNEKEEGTDAERVFKEAIPIEMAHRNEKQVADWVMNVLSDVLTFEDPDVKADYLRKKVFFSANGEKQFSQFLQDNKLYDALKTRRYVLRAFVNGKPSVVNQGAIGGRYRWLFKAPVMISIMEARSNDYTKLSDVASQEGVVQIQVGRIKKTSAENPEGMVVESWKGSLRPANVR